MSIPVVSVKQIRATLEMARHEESSAPWQDMYRADVSWLLHRLEALDAPAPSREADLAADLTAWGRWNQKPQMSGEAAAPLLVWRIEVFREDDGRHAAEFTSGDGKIGGMSNYANTPVGALAELCATLIKLDEDAASPGVSPAPPAFRVTERADLPPTQERTLGTMGVGTTVKLTPAPPREEP